MMLDYKNNRLDYGKLMSPPPGFFLDRAVATTFSLDIVALLAVPIALIYSKNLDYRENWMNNFYALQKVSDKLKIYCQMSKIAIPDKTYELVDFVRKSIFEVLPASPGISFHPKIWVLRFTGPENTIIYRFIVLSRNLTFDRSWDVAFSIEGFVGRSKQPKNKPLTDYLSHLKGISDFTDSTKFIRDLNKVEFQIDYPFENFEFFPMGFGRYSNPLAKEKFNDLIIISPFVDKKTLEYFSAANTVKGNKYLFSRKEELDKIHLDVLQRFSSVYSFSNRIVDGEEDIDTIEEDEIPLQQNLHAKLFIGTKPNGTTSWYLGSANCSSPAMTKNEEFMIRLDSIDNQTNVTSLLAGLTAKADDIMIFDVYNRISKEPVEFDEYDFRKDIFSLLHYLMEPGNMKIECRPNLEDNGKFDILIRILKQYQPLNSELIISFAPIGRREILKGIDSENLIVFEGIPLYRLSSFFMWSVEHQKKDQKKVFLLKMDFILPEGIREAIFKNIFENKDKFLQFLQFLLGRSSDMTGYTKNTSFQEREGSFQAGILDLDTPLFEELLIASSREPEKLKEIEDIINRIKATGSMDVIPKEFLKIWNAFHELI